METDTNKNESATFAGGCFWCLQPLFDQLKGVTKTEVGYAGGVEENPTYETVSSGTTGHREVIQIQFNPQIISYKQLLELFLLNIDPTNNQGQFHDSGPQYRTAVFVHNEAQKKTAKLLFTEMLDKNILEVIHTDILPAHKFYPAEDYHQDYSKKNPVRYERYHQACGRNQRLGEVWKKLQHK